MRNDERWQRRGWIRNSQLPISDLNLTNDARNSRRPERREPIAPRDKFPAAAPALAGKLCGGQAAQDAVGFFAAEFQRVFAQKLAALIVARGGQRLELKAPARQRDNRDLRGIEEEHAIRRHIARQQHPAGAIVALIKSHQIFERLARGGETLRRLDKAIDAALLRPAT